MFLSVSFLKKLNFDKLKKFEFRNRSHSIVRYFHSKTKIFIHRGLYSVYYTNNVFNRNYNFGMFALTRKPFAKPAKRQRGKKR
jgi:hypothetical protein